MKDTGIQVIKNLKREKFSKTCQMYSLGNITFDMGGELTSRLST